MQVLTFLKLEAKIKITFDVQRKTLFKRRISSIAVANNLLKIARYNNENSDSELAFSERVERLTLFINSTNKSRHVVGGTLVYEVDLNEPFSFVDDSQMLETLVEMGYLYTPRVEFAKEDPFAFDLASSGEKHLLFTMLNLIARIDNDSLILIDEPEISMHPSWQMRYINFLKLILSDYSSCHCILASHSHFMVSDLDPASSTLIQLAGTPDEDNCHRTAKLIEYDTYAWSAESILYNVFGMRTSKNYYFEQDLAQLLSLISQDSKDYRSISQLVEKLNQVVLSHGDPLIQVINKAKNYLDASL